MKNFFRSMDEMEFSISLRAIKIAWIYSVLVLFIRMIYDFAVTGSVIGFAFYLLITQNALFSVAQIYLKWKLGKSPHS